MQIRPYLPQDRQSVCTLFQSNVPGYFAPEEETWLLHFLDHDARHFFVAESDNQVIGCGGYVVNGPYAQGALLCWGIVHGQWHKKGIGTLLTRYRLQQIAEHHPGTLVSVRTAQKTYAFYERFGFTTKQYAKDYWGNGFDLYHMELQVN
jgi:ribosomal protein S18 acetylase RimI-like enzyme